MGPVGLVLLDTCALLWWTLDPERLSATAQQICAAIPTEGGFVSSISIWEIWIKQKKGTLEIRESLAGYVDRLKSLGCIEIVPVDEQIWLENIQLDWDHSDPADRTIVATALTKNLAILTKDQIILDFYPKAVW